MSNCDSVQWMQPHHAKLPSPSPDKQYPPIMSSELFGLRDRDSIGQESFDLTFRPEEIHKMRSKTQAGITPIMSK